MTRTGSRRQPELEELRRRLAEAEEALEAIRTGAVDALVVASPADEPRIYTLEGADRPYRLLIEQMQQGAATLGPDGVIVYCNPRLAQLLGVPAEQLSGTPLEGHIAKTDRPWLRALLASGATGAARGETHLQRADGGPVPVYLTLSALRAGAGAPLCVLVTDLSDAKYEDLYEKAPDMMCSVDVVTGLILQCNETLASVTGFAKREIVGQPVIGLYTEACREQAARNFAEFVHRGEVHDDELQIRCKNGRLLHVSLSVSAIRDTTGRIVRSRSVLRDITDRKQAELALREADRRKDEFLAILAHELRNPLAPIRNAVEVLRLQPSADPHLKWSREVIDRQVTQLTRLVDDLLDIARITRNRIELRRERVPLLILVQRAIEASQPLIEARRHQFSVSVPSEPLWLDVDAARIAQVLGNLLNNAAKYTPEGGTLSLVATREGAEACVVVQDNGVGIAPDVQSRVFEMFVQAEVSMERAQGGLGIGLTLVRSLVGLHGGSVGVHSDGIGRGARFTVRLPLAASGETLEHPRPGASCAVGAQPLRVLVVDDNPDAADSLKLLLSLQGHNVSVARDGLEAIACAERLRPDVILMDLGMPHMDGYEAAQQIRRSAALAGVTLVALTGWGQESDRARSRAAGFTHHLTKPVNLESLLGLLQTLAGHRGGEAVRH